MGNLGFSVAPNILDVSAAPLTPYNLLEALPHFIVKRVSAAAPQYTVTIRQSQLRFVTAPPSIKYKSLRTELKNIVLAVLIPLQELLRLDPLPLTLEVEKDLSSLTFRADVAVQARAHASMKVEVDVVLRSPSTTAAVDIVVSSNFSVALSVVNVTIEPPSSSRGAFVAQGHITLHFESLQSSKLSEVEVTAGACTLAGVNVCDILEAYAPEILQYPIDSIGQKELQDQLNIYSADALSRVPRVEYSIQDWRLNLLCHILGRCRCGCGCGCGCRCRCRCRCRGRCP